MSGGIDPIRRIVEEQGEADDVLRAVVDSLASSEDARWAGITFVEEGTLRLGPARGEPDEGRRSCVPISFQGAPVGELCVDGDVSRRELDEIAALIAPYVLIGWDTGGEAWDP